MLQTVDFLSVTDYKCDVTPTIYTITTVDGSIQPMVFLTALKSMHGHPYLVINMLNQSSTIPGSAINSLHRICIPLGVDPDTFQGGRAQKRLVVPSVWHLPLGLHMQNLENGSGHS